MLNQAAVAMAIRAGIALNCTINLVSQWARKNYFYPDLPKGYQISQFDRPIAEHGYLDIEVKGTTKRVRIERIHIEEDAGKSLHEGFPDSNQNTYVDFNRSGVPLVEIVTEPDLRSAEDASEYLTRLKQILEYLEVCDGNMDEGSLRCDANISICLADSSKFGTRTELKNINSFRFLEKAIKYEVDRQIDVQESGDRVIQETRLWNSTEERTVSMRSKENAHDYRYFPEPDLPLLKLEKALVEEIRETQKELPGPRRTRFIKAYALSEYDAEILTSTQALADYFEKVVNECNEPKSVANWVMGDLLRLMKDDNVDLKNLEAITVKPFMLAAMIKLVLADTISGKIAKTVIAEMYRTGNMPEDIIEKKGLIQINDIQEIDGIIDNVIASNPGPVEQYRSGKEGTLSWFVGQVMRETHGRANPQKVNALLRKKLAS